MEEEIIFGRKDHIGLITGRKKKCDPLLWILPFSNDLEATTKIKHSDRNY